MPLSMSLKKMLKSTGPKTDPCDTACDWHRTIDHNPLVASSQPIPNPLNSPSFKSILLQFSEKDVVRGNVKGFAEVQVDDTHRPSLIHRCRHSIIEGHQIGNAQSALGEATLAVSNHLFIS